MKTSFSRFEKVFRPTLSAVFADQAFVEADPGFRPEREIPANHAPVFCRGRQQQYREITLHL